MDEKKITRARNKTVILTPEMTNQMRNAMSKNLAESSGEWSKPSEGWERPSSSIGSGAVAQPVKETPQHLAPIQAQQQLHVEEDHGLEFNNFKSEEPNIQPIDVEDSWQAFTETVIEPVEMEPINPFANYQQENNIQPIAPFTAFESGENLEPLPQIEEPAMEELPAPVRVQEQTLSANRIQWEVETPIIGFLVSYDDNKNGEFYPLRVGRIAVTSVAPESGNYLMLKHNTVSDMHAVMKVTANARIQILDQLSEHGTKILKTGNEDCVELSGDKAELVHGDVVIFGERQFSVCVIDFGV